MTSYIISKPSTQILTKEIVGEVIEIPPVNSTSVGVEYCQIGKIPTTIRYNQDRTVAEIGEAFDGENGFESNFKSRFPKQIFGISNTSYDFRAKKLISDYLSDFGRDLLQLFLSKQRSTITRRDLKGT